MKKLISVLICAAIICTLFSAFGVSVGAATAADNNLWTKYAQEITPNQEGVYEITSPEELAWVAKMTNETPMTNGLPWSLKKSFRLMNSIDLSAHQWVPIGTQKGTFSRMDNLFYGMFEGNQNTIRGLTIQGTLTNENYQGIGLFGATGSFTKTNDSGVKVLANYIDNLFLKDINIDVTSNAANPTYVGSIVGVGNINLYNCSVSGAIKTKNVMTTGGMSGLQTESMTKCMSDVAINAGYDVLPTDSYVGGLVADFVQGSVTACASTGEIVTNNIENCGGIAGKTQDVIQASFTTSKITATPSEGIAVGNAVGLVYAGSGGTVLKCYAAADVNPAMDMFGKLESNPIAEAEGKTLEYMKTKDFINDLVTVSESVTPSSRLADKFVRTFSQDILAYTMVNGLPSSVKPVENNTQITANATISAPTYTVTIPQAIDFGEQAQALSKYADQTVDQYGTPIIVSKPFTVQAQNVGNLFDDLEKEPRIDVAVSFDGNMTGTQDASQKIPYTVKKGDAAFTSGEVFASFKNTSELTADESNTATGMIFINRTNITKSDSYTGTMTFTISIPTK